MWTGGGIGQCEQKQLGPGEVHNDVMRLRHLLQSAEGVEMCGQVGALVSLANIVSGKE